MLVQLLGDGILDPARTLDGTPRAGEGDHEAVALRLDLEPAAGLDLIAYEPVVRPQQLEPTHVAKALVQRGRPLYVREEDGDRAVRGSRRPQAGALGGDGRGHVVDRGPRLARGRGAKRFLWSGCRSAVQRTRALGE